MHQPTLRVLRILVLVAGNEKSLRLSDFSRELNIPKSTLLPILQTLCAERYLSQDDAGRYTPGNALFSISVGFSNSFPVLKYVHEQLSALVGILDETCYFGTLDNGSVLYLDKVDSTQPLRMLTSIGHRLPAYATGIGKSLLMDKTEAELSEIYPDGLSALTDQTVKDIPSLYHQLTQARLEGYTWEIEESTKHVRCFAAPIRKHGNIVAAISVTVPLFRYDPQSMPQLIRTLQTTAAQIGRTFEETNAHFGDSF